MYCAITRPQACKSIKKKKITLAQMPVYEFWKFLRTPPADCFYKLKDLQRLIQNLVKYPRCNCFRKQLTVFNRYLLSQKVLSWVFDRVLNTPLTFKVDSRYSYIKNFGNMNRGFKKWMWLKCNFTVVLEISFLKHSTVFEGNTCYKVLFSKVAVRGSVSK